VRNFAWHRKSGEVWKHLATIFLVWRNILRYLFLVRYSLKMCSSVIFIYTLYICTYVLMLIYSYAALVFLSLLMVWKFVTSNESVIVLKVGAWFLILHTSYVICLQNVETDCLEIFGKCWKPIRFLKKIQGER